MRVHGKNGFSDDVMNMLEEEDGMASYFKEEAQLQDSCCGCRCQFHFVGTDPICCSIGVIGLTKIRLK